MGCFTVHELSISIHNYRRNERQNIITKDFSACALTDTQYFPKVFALCDSYSEASFEGSDNRDSIIFFFQEYFCSACVMLPEHAGAGMSWIQSWAVPTADVYFQICNHCIDLFQAWIR